MDDNRTEQRAIVWILVAEGEHNTNIYRRKMVVYDKHCLGQTAAFKKEKCFRSEPTLIPYMSRLVQVSTVIDSVSILSYLSYCNRKGTCNHLSTNIYNTIKYVRN
ncbi:hypothetical protein NPIL_409391 [Nephila pilipes]|uniref:Uncharacterized protein n=1 Tax=Nephila pilipes TaxID=299642 RepID=A0A8X6MD00_NEPPI|nr:hypothetical protein NPIL_409391 [Nephila pilipes]